MTTEKLSADELTLKSSAAAAECSLNERRAPQRPAEVRSARRWTVSRFLPFGLLQVTQVLVGHVLLPPLVHLLGCEPLDAIQNRWSPKKNTQNTHTELDFYSKSSWTDECCIILYIQLFIHFLLVAQGEESFHPLRASAHWGVLQKQTASFMSHLCGPLTHELIMALGCMMWACLCLVNGMLVHRLQTRNNAGE